MQLLSLLEGIDWSFVQDNSVDIKYKFNKFMNIFNFKLAFPNVNLDLKWIDKDLRVLRDELCSHSYTQQLTFDFLEVVLFVTFFTTTAPMIKC